MNYILLLFLLTIVLVSFIQAQDGSNSSVTSSSWFWPFLAVCLILLITVPCTLGLIAFICQWKNSSEETSSAQVISSSSMPTNRRRRRNRRHHHHHQEQQETSHQRTSDHRITMMSPPPPYTSCEPPPYQSPVEPVQPLANTSLETATENPPTVIETSASLNISSMQTFQA